MIERDPVLCESCRDPSRDGAELVATPAGVLCQECAEEFAESEGWA